MRRKSRDLRGTVAVVTGGTSGIGAATTAELVRRGARVAVIDLDPDTAGVVARRHPFGAIGVTANVTDRAGLAAAMDEVVERFGRIDIVVANAGVLARTATLRTTPPEAIDQLFAVNMTGVLNTVQAALPQVIESRGQIVLLSSVFAFLNGMATIPYAMSKAAIEQLGRGLRVEMAAHDVSVTTVYFSLIDTPMIQQGVDNDTTAGDVMKVLPRPLLKRLTPAAAAGAIVDGLEKRSPRVMKPGRWIPFSVARGLIGPTLDSMLLRDNRLREVLTTLDNRQPPAQIRPVTTTKEIHQ
ncbi:SDR family NAD(P)-dependent oxidoreductase [Williamsia sp. MIQD14]|uniref:SDR family NAD(P)-dependent oxidoreductase n=1 Tax=Williamsia sp. MIQD14 TaxID=3425703 RepID=UPI003DA12984